MAEDPDPIAKVRELEARALKKIGEPDPIADVEVRKTLPVAHHRKDITDAKVRAGLAEGKSYSMLARELSTTPQTIYRRIRVMKEREAQAQIALSQDAKPANGPVESEELTMLADEYWHRLALLDKLRLLLR